GTAEYVMGDSVLVESDPTADVKLWASGNLYLSSTQGFTLRSLHATIGGDGVLQLQAPRIEAREDVHLNTFSSTIAVSAAEIKAKQIDFMVVFHGNIIVHSADLNANLLTSTVSSSSDSISFVGDGQVKKHRAVVLKGGEINTGGIVAKKAEAIIGWSGRILLSALDELEATTLIFGTIEYANLTPPPAIISDVSWRWWKDKKTPGTIARPAGSGDTNWAVKPFEFRDPPARQPVAIHQRMKKSSSSNEPRIVKPDEKTSWTARYSKLVWATGAVAVGAIVVIATKRRAARLA
ncbi:hypothetical protein Gpo141_00014368, partial [Globisporangium polare]